MTKRRYQSETDRRAAAFTHQARRMKRTQTGNQAALDERYGLNSRNRLHNSAAARLKTNLL
ncbi:hypothetical protein AA0498_0500 [Acidomonas methanolica]|uniref:Uncharacterized protein n=1 Tax=Acidomonas methanolica NBRC 104435 TaxID=1231351 RepID=A0A023D3T3_ACIMT|nr:hypothetical protein EDC31_102121 [Acidomonas methanolica]GAJ28787.1 hypothetical protein Amme_038_036 [Acidomonas methanolica NBRC 104435]GBQ47324.1 hypothetical protein AA0498_0500 [Acidomonas methanolica]GEK97991.1 hypothetical protein AME01nite_04900 [Acidomonas methanolica NBRC 104435]